MRYMLLIYGDESANTDMIQDPEVMKPWFDYTDWLRGQGWLEAGEPLEFTSKATTVRVQGGERLITDGPFAETKEQLGGYYIVDVPNLDDAIEAAARCPGALHGSMEVRPIPDMGGGGGGDAG